MTTHYKMRQLALVARELAPVEKVLLDIFSVEVAHRDPGVGKFGLENIVVPFGNQFIEVVAPIQPGTTAERYIDRRSGDGGYMVILQCDNLRGRDARVKDLGIRTVHSIDRDDYDGLQLHPRDTGGSFLEIDSTIEWDRDDGAWYPAGDDWQSSKNTSVVQGITAAELQSDDPIALAARWGAILGLPVNSPGSAPSISLDKSVLRFVSDQDGRGEGLSAIDVVVSDKAHVTQQARTHDCPATLDQVLIGGVRFNLISA